MSACVLLGDVLLLRNVSSVSIVSCASTLSCDCCLLARLQKEPSFGADTDEEEEERDDNLLPM